MRLRRFVLLGNLLLAAVLMLAVWVLLVWVASRPALNVLVDLTPQRVNSVDPVTEDLLRELRAKKTAVEFHVFAPDLRGQAQTIAQQQMLDIRGRVIDLTRILLRRYERLGGEVVTVHDYDFYGDSAATREAAQAFDYKGAEDAVLVVAVRPEGRERRYRKLSILSDLATVDLPGVRGGTAPGSNQAPVLKDYGGELAISSSLKSLLVQGVPVAYFVVGYSQFIDLDGTRGTDYGQFRHTLRQAGFDVRDLRLHEAGAVPPDASLVVVLEPYTEFVDRDADALYAYVKRGGRLFVDYVWSPTDGWNPTGGRLGELLGYKVSERLLCHLMPVAGRTGGRYIDGKGVEKLQLVASSLHPLTRRFVEGGRPLEVAAARAVAEREGAPPGMRREPFLLTGDRAWLATSGPEGPDFRAPGAGLQQYTVGLAIEVDADQAPGGKDAPAPGRVVLIGGMFCNNAGMPFFGDLALNVCNWMVERNVLLDIRGSRYESRVLDLQPAQLGRVWWLLEVWVPGVFVVLGFLVIRSRRGS